MDISRMGAQAQITSLEELSGGPAGAAHVAEFERAMGGAGSLGGDLLSELGQIRERFSQAKQELQVEPVDARRRSQQPDADAVVADAHHHAGRADRQDRRAHEPERRNPDEDPMRRTVKGLSRMALLALVLALGGCKVELYTGISQKEGNEMLALLRSEGVSADKQADKDGTVRLLVEESDIAEAVEVLKRKGYPRENFSTLKDVFPKDGLISSPIEERARLNYAKAQEISHTLSEIDGVLVARVHVVLPEERDGLGRKSSPASASVFIKHAADVQLDAYVPQIKQLVNNGIEGLSYDRISVVLVPSAGVRQVPLAPRFESVFSIQVAEHSRGRLLGLFGLLLALLLASNLAQFFWHRQRG